MGYLELKFRTDLNFVFVFVVDKILYANNLWLQGGSLQPNNGVCLSYLFIKLINDILDMASFEGDKFTLPVTIVSKEMMNTWVFDEGKPSLKANDRWRSAYANIVISEIVRIIITYVRQTEKKKGCSADVNRSV